VAGAFEHKNMKSQRFDWDLDREEMNFLSTTGLCNALLYILMLYDDLSLCAWGTVCSSWVWINRATSGRARHRAEGCSNASNAIVGNVMACRMVLLLLFLDLKNCCWLLEQPGSSYLKYCKWFMEYDANVRRIESVWTWMCEFGAPTKKGSELYFTGGWARPLRRTLTRATAAGTDNLLTVRHLPPGSDGRTRVTGSKELKSTQGYTKVFGSEVQQTHETHLALRKNNATPSWLHATLNSNIPIPDADGPVPWDAWRAAVGDRHRRGINFSDDARLSQVMAETCLPEHAPLVMG